MGFRSIENLQLDGGCLVFDFTNTINNRAAPEHDYLKTFEDLLWWSQRVGIIDSKRAKVLSTKALKNIDRRDFSFAKAIHLRETLYRLFSAIAKKRIPDPAVTKQFNETLAECFGKIKLEVSSERATPGFEIEMLEFDQTISAVMKSAYDTLTGEDFGRLKECPRCGWLFIDRTKNGKRRWCDMKVCGSKVKATRYYHKKKDESDETT